MDKTVILAVAGSGKTSLIIEKLSLDERALLITYTDNNLTNLRRRIIEKFGLFPEHIKLYSYFTFLYRFAYKPFLSFTLNARGINWNIPPAWTRMKSRDNLRFYLDIHNRLYHNRIAKLVEQWGVLEDINQRIEKYFDRVFVDEVQDFAGHDFNLLRTICNSNTDILLVGDFFQHTFDTSRDGNVNRGLHDNYENYVSTFVAMGLAPDRDTLKSSYRCSPTVCDFISDNIGISISSHRRKPTVVSVIEDEELVAQKFDCRETVKLFYQEHYKYPCYAKNWGASKGQDHYEDVCVVLSENNYSLLKGKRLGDLKPQTRNKLYVACSREGNNLYIVSDRYIKKHKRS